MLAPQIIGNLRVALDFDSNKVSKLQSHAEKNSGGTLATHGACNISAGLYIHLRQENTLKFGHCYSSEKAKHYIILVRSSESLNTRIRYSTYSPNFKSQKGSWTIEALNFGIITSQITSYLPNNPRKVKLLYIEDLIFF